MYGVHSLQRRLVYVSIGVSCVVGAVGYKMYHQIQDASRRVEEIVQNLEKGVSVADGSSSEEEKSPSMVHLKRVLVKKRKNDPNDTGQIVEVQDLGILDENLLKKKEREEKENQYNAGWISKVKSLPQSYKLGIFAVLAVGFFGEKFLFPYVF